MDQRLPGRRAVRISGRLTIGIPHYSTEDCVEELFHMVCNDSNTRSIQLTYSRLCSSQMHCVDACAAPRLFKRLV